MTKEPDVVSPGLQFVLATRHLERIADHATNIAEDIIFWVRGLDVRHGRLGGLRPEQAVPITTAEANITQNSQASHPNVTPAGNTDIVIFT